MVMALPERGWSTSSRIIDLRTDQERATMDRIERIRSAHWRVVTGVRTRRGQPAIHVAIGPTGVFAINAELHDGEVRIDGNRMLLNSAPCSIFERTMGGADAIRACLEGLFDNPIEVTPILVLDGCTVKLKQPPDRMLVLQSRHLRRFFRQQRSGPFSPEQRAQIETAMREHDRLLR